MSTLTESHARLSEKSYSPHGDRIDIEAFELVKEVGTSSGYHGVIYRNVKTGDYVVSHTGTEFDTDKIRDGRSPMPRWFWRM